MSPPGICQQENIVLRNDNTFALIDRSARVVTVNSTVGLQSQLAGKPVTYLGRSVYEQLKTDRLFAQYLMGYLLEIDFFDDAPLTLRQVEAVLSRAG